MDVSGHRIVTGDKVIAVCGLLVLVACQREPALTTEMGASALGLISLYAQTGYPEVFGGAGCMSTHWPRRVGDGKDNLVSAAFFRYIEQQVTEPDQHR